MPSNRHSNSSKRTPHRMSHYTSSHYPDEQVLHFYRWKSPPGVMKILSIIVIIMCVAVFVCVASTLAWDYNMDGMGLGGLGMGGMGSMGGMGGMGGGGYYGSNMYGGGVGSGSYGYGGGYGGGYMDPTTGKGFMIAIAAIAFITVLVIFILVVSRQKSAKSARFYLVSIIICAILALLMFIASVVYLVAVNPMAQSSGSMMYSMIWQLCSQFQNQNQAQASALLINQYMYHYCVVDPQEAIAIVLGFLVCIALIIMMVFAIKSRSQINRYGMHRVLWEEPPSTKDGFPHGVEKWVTDVSGEAEAYLNDHNTQIGSSRNYLDQTLDVSKPLYLPGDSDTTSTTIVLKGRARDYDTGAESADELDDADYDR
ncbi:hypothetical protein AMELA_G00242020 [Ameiurus melas]|uniref:MARVEL domain-containing protein n=1 Tax=Ameiurus melas TaxID=219545 RepID=A0A7J5ZZM5_AMEME|nr:hypothetical protein AMELA_G00242020 [Ameiurus melas]